MDDQSGSDGQMSASHLLTSDEIIEMVHRELDTCGVPRLDGYAPMTLGERFSMLRGLIEKLDRELQRMRRWR